MTPPARRAEGRRLLFDDDEEVAPMSMSGNEDTSGRDAQAGGETPPDAADRQLYERFLPPEPFRGIDPALYAMRHDAALAETVRAWHSAQRWSETDQDAAHAMRNAEAHLRSLSPPAMALYDEQRSAGVMPTLAMAAASVELQTQVVMSLLDELEVEAGERGLNGRERDDWVERQVEHLTDLDTDLPASGRAAVSIADRYRSLVASMPSPADQWIHDLGRGPHVDHSSSRLMSPAEAAAYMAEHPEFARRVEERGRELAEEYGPRLAGGPMPVGTAPVVADGPATRPASTAREQVGGLLGYILSNGSTPVLSPDGDDEGDGEGADDRPAVLAVDGLSPIAEPAEADGLGEPEELGAASLDW